MENAKLPVIDLTEANGSTRSKLRDKLYEALTTSGFFYLKGIQGYDSEELLKSTHWFFNLPLKEKMSITKKMFDSKSNFNYRGYFPAIEGEVSFKEAFEMGPDRNLTTDDGVSKEEAFLTENNQWPDVDSPDGTQFKKTLEKHYHLLLNASLEIMGLIAEIWGMNKETLTDLFDTDHLSTLRLLHYPQRQEKIPEEAIDEGIAIITASHADSGFLTLLSTFDYAGLQIRLDGKQWLAVPKLDNCMVVNIGKNLATISGGVLKATDHRVIDIGSDRYSAPFFFEPSFHTNINIRLPSMDPKIPKPRKLIFPSDETVEYGTWLMKRIPRYAEYRNMLKFL